jgi:iron complex transport system substrate-binding protein
MRRLRLAAVVAAVVVIPLSGCASEPKPAPAAPASGSFPVTVTAGNGTVAIPGRPTRIVSMSATSTEMLYAIGAGSQVVAVDKYSTDPPGAPTTGFTGSETSAEGYMTFHPDLVVLAFDTGHNLVAQLGLLHVPTLLLPPATSMEDTYRQFEELGQATGHASAAAREVASIRQQLDSISGSVGNRARGLTYYQEIDNTLYTATSKTFIGALYARLGMVNIADPADHLGSGYPQLSPEYLIKADPDVVFLADTRCCGQTAATFAARAGYSVMRAVRLGHVFPIADPIASEWGPRVVDFLRTVADDLGQATLTPSGSAMTP